MYSTNQGFIMSKFKTINKNKKMKRILIALTAVILCCNAIAQTKMTGTPVQKIPHKSQYNMGNYIVMTDGKMTAMINGESIPMK